MPPFAVPEAPVAAPFTLVEGVILKALGGIPQSRLRRLRRVGLLRWTDGDASLNQLRRQHRFVQNLEDRVDKLARGRLVPAERNAVIDWLAEIARAEGPLDAQTPAEDLSRRVRELINRLDGPRQ